MTMRTVHTILSVSFEMGKADDYPEDVQSWGDAVDYELDQIYVSHSEGVEVFLYCIDSPGDPRFMASFDLAAPLERGEAQ